MKHFRKKICSWLAWRRRASLAKSDSWAWWRPRELQFHGLVSAVIRSSDRGGFVWERKQFVFDTFINLEPVNTLKNSVVRVSDVRDGVIWAKSTVSSKNTKFWNIVVNYSSATHTVVVWSWHLNCGIPWWILLTHVYWLTTKDRMLNTSV